MKVGDLVRHIEDEVLGLIVEGPIAYDVPRTGQKPDVYAPRFKVQWFDCIKPCDEAEKDMLVVSTSCKKVENNLNIFEQPTSN